MPDKTDYPSHTCAAELLSPQRACSFCGQVMVKGYTNKGNISWFDPVPPYPNHWIGCPNRKEAAAALKAKRR